MVHNREIWPQNSCGIYGIPGNHCISSRFLHFSFENSLTFAIVQYAQVRGRPWIRTSFAWAVLDVGFLWAPPRKAKDHGRQWILMIELYSVRQTISFSRNVIQSFWITHFLNVNWCQLCSFVMFFESGVYPLVHFVLLSEPEVACHVSSTGCLISKYQLIKNSIIGRGSHKAL